jgi:hypothetical protein
MSFQPFMAGRQLAVFFAVMLIAMGSRWRPNLPGPGCLARTLKQVSVSARTKLSAFTGTAVAGEDGGADWDT